MIRHTLLILYRNLKRDISTFAINLLGLTAGLTCTILIFLWLNDEITKNQFHENIDRLYHVLEHQQYADHIVTTQSTPGPLAEALKAEIPEVELAATTTWTRTYEATVDELSVNASGFPAGRDFFEMFSFPMLEGAAKQVLSDESSIVISDELAIKLFGQATGVTGKQIVLNKDKAYQVSGVFKMLTASSLQFDLVTSYEAQQKIEPWMLEWGSNGPPTYVLLRQGTDVEIVNQKIKDFVKRKKEDSHVTLFLQSYADGYLHDRWDNGKLIGGRIEYVRLFSMVAVAILLIACINFMNLSTAQASRRAKEVGVKKSVGAERNSLIAQFLTESMTIALAAFIMALLLVGLMLPIFNEITQKQITLVESIRYLPILLGITLLTGIFSGSYPALFLSAFKPVEVLKGEHRSHRIEILMRKGLVVFQFAVAVMLIASILVIQNQIQFVQNRPIGYDRENLLRIPVSGKSWQVIEPLLAELNKLPGVTMASSVGHNVSGRNNNTWGLHWPGKHPDDRILFESMYFNYESLDVMGFTLAAGRNFSRDYGSDTTAVLLNEAAIRVMNLENPIGQQIKIYDSLHTIIGVINDFNFQSLHSQVEPAYMLLDPRNTWNVFVRVTPGNVPAVVKEIEATYKKHIPGFTFNYTFQDDAYSRMYQNEQRVATLAIWFAFFAIIISCLGLYGLAAHSAERRLKEMGIRKALGLSAGGILILLSKDFTRLVVAGIIIGVPVSYWWLSHWLQRFAFHIDLTWWYFVIAALVALCIAWLTVASKAWRAAQVNPVDCIRLDR